MKKVELHNKIYYFSLAATMENICDYFYSIREQLDLNEYYTCKFSYEDEIIIIKGDEDYLEKDVEVIEPIF